MPILDKLASLIGGNITDGVAKIIQCFKVDPALALQKQVEVEEIKLQMAEKLQDAISNEVTQAAEVIKAEAQSQSWLPRNVRPLVLLGLSIPIIINGLVPIFARFWIPDLKPFPLDPWVYKLVAIGFTGYVTARTWEKVTDSDN